VTSVPVLLLAAAAVGFGHAVLPDHWVPLAMLARARRYPLRRVLRQSGAAAVTHILLSLLLGGVLILIGLQFRETVQRHEDMIVGGLLLTTGLIFLVLELAGRGHRHTGHVHSHDAGSHGEHHGHEHHGHEHHPHEHHGHQETQPEHSGGHLAVLDLPATEPDNRVDCAIDPVLTGSTARSNRLAARQASGEPRDRGLFAVIAGFGAAASPDLTILPVFLAASALGAGAAAGSLAIFALVTFATIVGLTVLAALGARLLAAAWIDRCANQLTAAVLIVIGGVVASGLA
jgi:threonine/homoserine/homoserine lactone efflux protein